MAQSVELLLDDATDAAIRRQWEQLQDAGPPSQARHPSASNRPHVTLAVSSGSWQPATEAELEVVCRAGGPPLPVRLGALLIFPRRAGSVLARLVVPGAWTLHVTLAREVDEILDHDRGCSQADHTGP